MKFTYLLKNYDRMLLDIYNPKKRQENTIFKNTNNSKLQHHRIHKVLITKRNKNISFAFSNPISSLHPSAPIFTSLSNDDLTEIEEYIPIILSNLKLPANQLEYHFTTHPAETLLYILEPISNLDCTNEHLFFYYCCQVLKTENEKITKLLKRKFDNHSNNATIREYIHKKQLIIDKLSKKLLKEINPINCSELYQISDRLNTRDCLKATFIYLERLNQLLETEYQDFLNDNGNVPYLTVLQQANLLAPKVASIIDFLNPNHLDKKLVASITSLVRKFEQHKFCDKITYKEFFFYNGFIAAIHLNILEFDLTASNEVVCDWFFTHNINSLAYFDFITDKIANEIDLHATPSEKLAHLYKVLKIFNQKNIKINGCYATDFPSTNTQVASWIEEEIEYLTRQIKLESNHTATEPITTTKTKIETDLSVHQLTYFMKLLCQIGIIKSSTNEQLFRFISENFKTKHVSNISIKSISAKFYSIEHSTINTIRSKVIELLNLTKL